MSVQAYNSFLMLNISVKNKFCSNKNSFRSFFSANLVIKYFIIKKILAKTLVDFSNFFNDLYSSHFSTKSVFQLAKVAMNVEIA